MGADFSALIIQTSILSLPLLKQELCSCIRHNTKISNATNNFSDRNDI